MSRVNPLISICIPTYNGQEFLEVSLQSAIGQTYQNIEIIIVDDCSTDSTWDIVSRYSVKDARVKLFRNEKNAGLVGNWNRCVELASGEWIKFLFQDDYLSLDCIEVMVNALSANDKIVSSARRLVLDKSLDEATKNYSITQTLTFERLGIISKVPVFISPEKISSFVAGNISMNFIGEPTVIMFKKEVVKEFGFFNPDIVQICDLEYFLKIACNYGVKYVPQPITYFRVHTGSASTANVGTKIFSMSHIDPMMMVYELLYDNSFARFRKSLSAMQLIKVKIFFAVRVYQSYANIPGEELSSENVKRLKTIADEYPAIAESARGNIFVKILLGIVKLKRRIRNKS